MAVKKSYPLRIHPQVLAAVQRWADDELRSVNAQIEYLLRDALVRAGRVRITQKAITEIDELADTEENSEPDSEGESE